MTVQQPIPLSSLPVGKKGKVDSLSVPGVLRRRLLDLGIVPNSVIEAVRVSPAGDPTAYLIKGTLIGLRKTEARQINIYPLGDEPHES